MMPIDTEALDTIAARFAARGGQPGVAYGIVAGGSLAHAGGCGQRQAGHGDTGPAPDADTVFRIASMTKSFTATLLLALRDRGQLRLSDPAVSYVPELAGLRLPAADCAPVTIRQLMTMTAGFPTDDPWGDRQQGLDPAEFARLLAGGGIRCAWAPGTRFEYSNLGYAILGKVIESVCGLDYARAIRTHLLDPLGLARTGYFAAEFDQAQLARGYRRDGDSWLELEPDPYGAFAPMGGIFSCVRDLAVWVAGFADAFPARDEAGPPHPLSRASRREMQLGQVAIDSGGDGTVARFSGPASLSYGFGLFAEDDPRFGPIVQHSGGYPGFGSQMRWHPATGLGAIVLCNSTYARAGALASELLASVLAGQTEQTAQTGRATAGGGVTMRGPVPGPGGPWPETLEARDAVNRLLQEWDDDLAARLFSPNIELDRPLGERRADLDSLRARIGAFSPDAGRLAECDSPAHCRWWLTGPAGTIAVQIELAPLRQPLVQQLLVALPPADGSVLHTALRLLAGAIGAGAASWPAGLAVANGLEAGQALRQLRLAAVWGGPGAGIDCYLAGDGSSSATVRLAGPAGAVELTVNVDEAAGAVNQVQVVLSRPAAA
jgi:CubicO group peptidase (beta-lactamase class C family)